MKWLGGWLREFSDELIDVLPVVGTIRRVRRRNEWLENNQRALVGQHERDLRNLSDAEEARVKERAQRVEAEERFACLQISIASDVPGLTDAEIERLALLGEACGSAMRAAAAVLLYGREGDSHTGGMSKPNYVTLERECGDLYGVLGMLMDAGDVRKGDVNAYARNKRFAMQRWTHHQTFSKREQVGE